MQEFSISVKIKSPKPNVSLCYAQAYEANEHAVLRRRVGHAGASIDGSSHCGAASRGQAQQTGTPNGQSVGGADVRLCASC